MKSSTLRTFLALLSGAFALAGGTTATSGQDPTNTVASPPEVARQLTGTNSIPLAKVPSAVLGGLAHEDVLNELSGPLLHSIFESRDTNAFLEFINELHLRPKLFQATGSSNNATFGMEFDYKKSLASHVLNESSKNPVGLALGIHAKGDIAIEARKNPNNLIEAGGSLHLFQGLGGVEPYYADTPESKGAVKKAQQENQDNLFKAAKGDKSAEHTAATEFTAHMRPQLFYDLQAHGTFETDQQFDNKQWTYGGKFSFAFRDWRSKSEVGWFNVFDYPFAALRSLINREEFQPSGRSFPSVVAGVDLVDPSLNHARLAVDADKDAFPRLRVEVGFKTPFMRFGSDHLYVSAAFRHFEELGPSALIRSAKLDHSDYFVARVDLPYKFNISYSTGKLPLDRKDDQVYAVGWNLNF